MRPLAEHRRILSDLACHAAQGDPAQPEPVRAREWNDRLLIETVLSGSRGQPLQEGHAPRLGVFRGLWHAPWPVERAGAVAWLACGQGWFRIPLYC